MSEETSKADMVKEVTAEVLPKLLEELEEAYENDAPTTDYEINFLGDLYARMIVSVCMGYRPERLGRDAEDSAYKLFELAEEHDDETEEMESNQD